MPRTPSSNTLESMLGWGGGGLLMDLVEIDHPSMSSPIRIVSNVEDVSSNGAVYTATNIRVHRPEEGESSRYTGRIEIDNSDQILTPTIRSLVGGFTVTLTLVAATDLVASPPVFDTVEMGPVVLDVESVEYNNNSARINLEFGNLVEDKFPRYLYDSFNFPGIH